MIIAVSESDDAVSGPVHRLILEPNGPDMTPYPLDHVAIATNSIRKNASLFELLTRASCSPIEEIPSQQVRVAFIGRIELIEPTSPDSGVGRFLERRGPGIHHIAYRVPDIRVALRHFEAQGLKLIDREPRPGAGGHQVAFLHPSSTEGVLWELVESPGSQE